MSTKEITAIAIKFLAIWLLIQVLLQAPSLIIVINSIEGFTQQESDKNLYITLVLSYLVVGSVISFLLYRVANSILTSIPDSNDSDTSNLSQSFLLQLGGVYFIVSGILLMFSLLASSIKQSTIPLESYIYMCGALFELVVGLSMLIKSSVWALWFTKLRGRA